MTVRRGKAWEETPPSQPSHNSLSPPSPCTCFHHHFPRSTCWSIKFSLARLHCPTPPPAASSKRLRLLPPLQNSKKSRQKVSHIPPVSFSSPLFPPSTSSPATDNPSSCQRRWSRANFFPISLLSRGKSFPGPNNQSSLSLMFCVCYANIVDSVVIHHQLDTCIYYLL